MFVYQYLRWLGQCAPISQVNWMLVHQYLRWIGFLCTNISGDLDRCTNISGDLDVFVPISQVTWMCVHHYLRRYTFTEADGKDRDPIKQCLIKPLALASVINSIKGGNSLVFSDVLQELLSITAGLYRCKKVQNALPQKYDCILIPVIFIVFR